MGQHLRLYDEMGNTLMLTDEAGAVVAAYACTPYGQIVGKSGATADNPFTLQYTYDAAGNVVEHKAFEGTPSASPRIPTTPTPSIRRRRSATTCLGSPPFA